MAFTATPVDGSGTPIPMSSAVPDGTNTPLAIEGGPSITTGGNTLVPVSMYVKDGNDVTQGTSTDAANANSVIGQLKQVVALLDVGQENMANSLSVAIASDQSAVPVSGTFWQATQPVSGTVTANAGTNLNTSTLALESGGNLASIVTALDDGQETMANSLSVTIASDQSAVPVSGTFWQATQPVSQATASSLNAQVVGNVASGASDSGNPVKVGGVYNSSPITLTNGQRGDLQVDASGFLEVNIKAGSSSGTQYTDGNAPPANPVGNALIFDSSGTWKDVGIDQGLPVNIVAGGGSGGTAIADDTTFTAGTTVFTPVGGVYNDAIANATSGKADAARITQKRAIHINPRDSSGNELLGSKTSANSVPVVIASDQGAFTVTANAGTNLNTSALALDTSVNGVIVAQGSTTSGEKGPMVQGAVTTAAPSYTTAQTSPLSLNLSGGLRVDGSGVTQPVSGTFWQATQPVSGTVTANAGTNLNTSALALESGGNLASILTALDDGQETMANSLSVTIASDQSAVPVSGTFWQATQPVSGTVTANQGGAPWSQNVTQFGGVNISTGTGAGGTGMPRVTVSNDTQLQLWDGTTGPVAVEGANESPDLTDKAMVHVISPNNTGLPVNTPAIVQKTNNKSSGSVASLALAFGSNNIAGNSIVVVCAVGNGTAPTITDTAANTYTKAAQIANGTAVNTAVFYAVGIVAGANTVTVNNGGTTASIAMEIYEVSGLLASVPNQPDQTATNTGSSGTASTGTVSALSPNELAFASVGIGTAAQTITAGAGWTNDSGQQNPTTPAGLFSFISMSQFLGSLKAVTPQATFTSEPWAIAVATFRPVILGVEGTTKLTDGTVTMAFGQNTMANSVPVTMASNQSNMPINVAQFGGTNVVTGTGAGGAGVPRITVSNDSTVGANSATGSAVPANAFYMAGDAATALPAAATGGNLTGAMVDKFGRQIVVLETVRDLKSNITPITLTSTTETTLIAAVAATFNDITSIIALNTSATAVRVDFRDSTGGTIQAALYLPAGDTRGFSSCCFKQTTVNNNWTAQLSGAVTDVRLYGTYVANK